MFKLGKEEAVRMCIKEQFEGFISKEIGIVIDVADVKQVKEGIVIPGDGAAYYETVFSLFTFKPEIKEVMLGIVKDVADFGVFMNIGPIEGMIHVSQTMDDYVSFSKEKVLTGKESKRTLKIGDKCKARLIAASFKDIANPKIGLTMRQEGLGKLEWLEEEKKPKKEEKPKEEKKKKK